MIIRKAFKFRLKPTEEQASALRQHGGNTRFLYNLLLERHELMYSKEHRGWTKKEMMAALPGIKSEHPFLKESNSQSLQQVVHHLDYAYINFYEKRAKHPTVKRKHDGEDSFSIPQHFRFSSKDVTLPKIGKIKWVKHREIQGTPKSLTVTQDGERWFCSVACEVETPDHDVKTDDIVGVDLGLKEFLVASDGTRVANLHFLKKKEKRLKRAQRKLSRRQIGSKNREKQRVKVRSIHRKVRDARRDFLHQTTSALVRSGHDGFAIEGLNVSGMLKNHHLSKAISDVGWYEFGRQLEYKSLWNGKSFVRIDRFFPSSKTCSACGWINPDLKLKDRAWSCLECGAVHDRDLNAAINIAAEGHRVLAANTPGLGEINARGEGGSDDGHGRRETTLDSHEAGKRSAAVAAGSSRL